MPSNETSFVVNGTLLPSNETPFVVNETSFPFNETSFVVNETSFPSNETSFVVNETSFLVNETSFGMEERGGLEGFSGESEGLAGLLCQCGAESQRPAPEKGWTLWKRLPRLRIPQCRRPRTRFLRKSRGAVCFGLRISRG